MWKVSAESKMPARAVAESGHRRVPVSSVGTVRKLCAAALWKRLPVLSRALPVPRFGCASAGLSGGVLRPAVAVDHSAGFRAAGAAGRVEGVGDQVAAVVAGHRVAGRLTGGRVRPGGGVEPAFAGGGVGDVPGGLRAGRAAVRSWLVGSADGAGLVPALVSLRRPVRRPAPAMPCSRMTGATRLRFTGRPWRRGSAVMRAAP